MLFNSLPFIFLFLPITILGFYYSCRVVSHRNFRFYWLILSSLFFYGYWNPKYVALLVASITGNYLVSRCLGPHGRFGTSRKVILTFGVTANLTLLAYFKYMDFFVTTLNQFCGFDFLLPHVILPLAISFHTFQQISYLIEVHRGTTSYTKFHEYFFFVLFFPQLIAGPIVRHNELIPQLGSLDCNAFLRNINLGISVFAIGLFKKVVFADGISSYADSLFSSTASVSIDLFQAWVGALSYTLQLYFDFSGYSDMAIGLACMFGLTLPVNFNSPYKARSIVDFWRRWHISLSLFLRDYLYIPLGGNRGGPVRLYANIMIVMLLGGLWHGAGWTFVLWGGLHGAFISVNRLWTKVADRVLGPARHRSSAYVIAARGLTLCAVVVGWVFFRAGSIDTAVRIVKGMFGLNGVVLSAGHVSLLGPVGDALVRLGVAVVEIPTFQMGAVAWIVTLFGVALLAPNTFEITGIGLSPGDRATPATTFARSLKWTPSPRSAVAVGVLGAIAVASISSANQFLYFQF